MMVGAWDWVGILLLVAGLGDKEVVIGFEITNEWMDLGKGEAFLLGRTVTWLLEQTPEIFQSVQAMFERLDRGFFQVCSGMFFRQITQPHDGAQRLGAA